MQVMNPFDNKHAGHLYGTYLAEVVSVEDPENNARVQIRLFVVDGLEDHDAAMWARVATAFAGNQYGSFFIPNVGDEVLVSFIQGDSRLPIIVGSLWNGSTDVPDSLSGGEVNRWSMTGRKGTRIEIDEESSSTVKIETQGGNTITITDDGTKIELSTSGGDTITMEPSGITIDSAAIVTVNASQVKVSAAMVTVDSGFSDFSGVVKCNTLIATTVVSSSYTPGAGNVW